MGGEKMKIVVPDYYKDFKCIADKCKHTCCKGWEVEIDDESMERFKKFPDITAKIETTDDNHFRLLDGEVCPFLKESGLCEMILKYGEDMLCQTCTDHPRFRNYWSDRIEMGLGLVCEEAAKIILTKETPMKLILLDDSKKCVSEMTDKENASEMADKEIDANEENASEMTDIENTYAEDIEGILPDDEEWLMGIRDDMFKNITESGPIARLKEYLIFRHVADALYDDKLEERIDFVNRTTKKLEEDWLKSDGSIEALVEIVRQYSYDVEYDEDVEKY